MRALCVYCAFCLGGLLCSCESPTDCLYRPLDYATVAFFREDSTQRTSVEPVFDSVVLFAKSFRERIEVVYTEQGLRLPLDLDTTAVRFLMYKQSQSQVLSLRYHIQLARVEESCGTELHIFLDKVEAPDFSRVEIRSSELLSLDSAHVELTL